MSSDILIDLENVSKKYCRDLRRSLWYGVEDLVTEMSGNARQAELRPKEFWAVDNVSFELRRGEVLGLVGPNGAGKTTLLKMLNGLIKPDVGSIRLRGHTAALIALGMGFNPILTGRENVYINAAVLGLTKKAVSQTYDEIVAFSELAEFMETPVRAYSTGMRVRLGFAIAVTLLTPDILLMDEVLAVGDAAFRMKCLNTVITKLPNSAVVFVSHQESQIKRICSHGMLLHEGRMCLLSTDLSEVYRLYGEVSSTASFGRENSWSFHAIVVRDVSVNGIRKRKSIVCKDTDSLEVSFTMTAKTEIKGCLFRVFSLSDNGDVRIMYEARETAVLAANEATKTTVHVPELCIASGRYRIALAILDCNNHAILARNEHLITLTVSTNWDHPSAVTLQAKAHYG